MPLSCAQHDNDAHDDSLRKADNVRAKLYASAEMPFLLSPVVSWRENAFSRVK